MKKLIYFELRKIFSKRLSMVTLIGILLFSALLSFSTYQNKYAFDQNAGEGSGKAAVEIDKEIAAKYEGILTDEKVRQMDFGVYGKGVDGYVHYSLAMIVSGKKRKTVRR